MAAERWRSIDGFPNHQVSDLGRVRGPRGIRTLSPHNAGYLKVALTMAPRSTFTVHKLVTRAFIGPIPKGFCVNHKNGVKTDNRLTNLEYVTRSDNNLDWRRREGRRGAPIQRRATTQAKGEDHGMAKLSQKQVFRIHRLFASGLLRREISDKTGISYWVVRNIISGRAWIHLHPEYQF